MDGYITIGTELNTKSFEKQINEIEGRLEEIDLMLSKPKEFNLTETDMEKLNIEAEKLNNKLADLLKKQAKLDSEGMPNINQIMSDINGKTSNVISKVAKWALAIFSVRSAYSFIRNSISTLSQYNKKIGADIEYIRFALASSLQPLIEKIIQLVYKLLAYIGYIAKAWFGVELFANASAKAFENAKKQVSGTNKEAKQLQKTLLGFDEMNILQDNGTTSIGGGGGGVSIPSYDLAGMENIEIPSWIKWIADNGTTVATIIGLIGTAIAGLKLAGLVANLEKAGIHVMGLFDWLSKFNGLQIFGMVAGFAITVAGLVQTISSLITFINDPSWENFVGVLSGLETVLIGVGLAMISFNASNPIGWITIAIGLIGKLVSALAEDESKTIDLTKAKQNLNNAEKEFVNAQSKYTTAIKNRDQALKDLQAIETKSKQSGEDLYKSVMTGQLRFEDMTDQLTRDTYLAYVKYKGAVGDVDQATKDLQDEEHELILTSLEEQATISATKNDFEDFSKTLNNLIDNGTISVEEAYKIINDVFGNMDGLGKDVLGIQFPKYFSSSTDSAEKLRKKVQDLYNQYKKLKDLGFPSTSGSSYSNKTLWAKGGVVTYAKGGIVNPIKLARGAVVNNPGPGVPITRHAIAGEQGAEGVIPLTDAQQMDLLGSAIGRRVTINLTNITEMNGRIISRELQRVQNQEDFAFNG